MFLTLKSRLDTTQAGVIIEQEETNVINVGLRQPASPNNSLKAFMDHLYSKAEAIPKDKNLFQPTI